MNTPPARLGGRRHVQDDSGAVRPGVAAYLAMLALVVTGSAAFWVTLTH
ncbi:MAG: hypothetical protein JOY99_11350 [Sphingomonadaceae bacterium]|nr:hypothetical protein [Sphingomonadaceae bacterium]